MYGCRKSLIALLSCYVFFAHPISFLVMVADPLTLSGGAGLDCAHRGSRALWCLGMSGQFNTHAIILAGPM